MNTKTPTQRSREAAERICRLMHDYPGEAMRSAADIVQAATDADTMATVGAMMNPGHYVSREGKELMLQWQARAIRIATNAA